MEYEQSSIVPQLVKINDYKNWRCWMQNYLTGQELWDVVDGTEPKPEPTLPEFKAWRTKNSKALHVIRLSCSPQIVSGIIALDSAKDVWDQLFSAHQEWSCLPNYWDLQPDEGLMNRTWGVHLYKAVESRDWECIKRIIDAHPEAMTGSVNNFGGTALHVASMSGQVRLVEELVRLMTPDQLEAKTIDGNTVLNYAAESGVTKIAKTMVRRNPNLVCIENCSQIIPVVKAAQGNHKDMAYYLYSVTPKQELSPERRKWGAALLTATIIADMFDIALDLLDHHPRLATTLDVYGSSAIYELSRRSSAFSSGNCYSFWQQWIYSWIHVQATYTLHNICGDVDWSHQSQVQQQQKVNHVYNILLELVWGVLKVTGMKQIYDKKLLNTQALT